MPQAVSKMRRITNIGSEYAFSLRAFKRFEFIVINLNWKIYINVNLPLTSMILPGCYDDTVGASQFRDKVLRYGNLKDGDHRA